MTPQDLAPLRVTFFFVLAGVFILLPSQASGGEETINFEETSPDLPGWSATMQGEDKQSQYRAASKWDVPFTISLDGNKPHSGLGSLKWEFSADSTGLVSLGPPFIPVAGADVEIRFFVRSEGMNGEGLLAFDESDGESKRLKPRWNVAKIPMTEEWTEVVWQGTLESAASGVRLRFVFKSAPAGARIWIDDLTVKSGE